MTTATDILRELPYDEPFRFVDEIHSFSTSEIYGSYTFKEDEYFFSGHFRDFPVTPGVILAECMAQIGLVCLGIVLLDGEIDKEMIVGLSSVDVDFLRPVYPGSKVMVHSKKEYFRFGKLKCKVSMSDDSGEIIARGCISGMLLNKGSG